MRSGVVKQGMSVAFPSNGLIAGGADESDPKAASVGGCGCDSGGGSDGGSGGGGGGGGGSDGSLHNTYR